MSVHACVCTCMCVGGCVDCVHGVYLCNVYLFVFLCLCVCAHRILSFTEYLAIIRVWGVFLTQIIWLLCDLS